MRQYLLLFSLLAISVINSHATTVTPPDQNLLTESKSLFSIPKDKGITLEQFLKLTPKEIEKITGKKLNFIQVAKLKIVQKKIKRQLAKPYGGQRFSKGVWILLAIFGWCWLLMGVSDDWSGGKWITNLILYVLCWLPGFIHSLVHMKDYTE